jgi:hypothetical protein
VAVDEVPNHAVQVRLRRKLEELVGVDEADLLMDRPPGGWSSLVTKDWLDERLTHERELTDERFRGIDHQFAALEHKMLGAMHEEFRNQTWRLITALFGAIATLAAAVAMIVGATQL